MGERLRVECTPVFADKKGRCLLPRGLGLDESKLAKHEEEVGQLRDRPCPHQRLNTWCWFRYRMLSSRLTLLVVYCEKHVKPVEDNSLLLNELSTGPEACRPLSLWATGFHYEHLGLSSQVEHVLRRKLPRNPLQCCEQVLTVDHRSQSAWVAALSNHAPGNPPVEACLESVQHVVPLAPCEGKRVDLVDGLAYNESESAHAGSRLWRHLR